MTLSFRIARPLMSGLARPAVRAVGVRVPAASAALRAAGPLAQRRMYSGHDLTYEEFTKKFEQEFDEAYDLYEVQRVLNNAFSYDLVPAPTVLERALKAARRVNDYATASRVFEALRFKVSDKTQYDAYLEELKEIREELGITLHEDLFVDEEQ